MRQMAELARNSQTKEELMALARQYEALANAAERVKSR